MYKQKNTRPTGSFMAAHRPLTYEISSISSPLTKLFNLSLQLKQLPDVWKDALINLIIKYKGSAQDVTYYRPILNNKPRAICNVMEK